VSEAIRMMTSPLAHLCYARYAHVVAASQPPMKWPGAAETARTVSQRMEVR
jgi:hypothetical protein